EIRTIISGKNSRNALLRPWLIHVALCGIMALLIQVLSHVPVWQWLASIYLGHSILLIRTFLEHQAAPDQSQRTVIIETACPIAFLFLFNNYHFVHHERPHVPWYRLPSEYRKQRDQFLADNGAYVYRSYMEIFRKFFLRSKEPVAHPFLRRA
ncbi:MAG: fatty acid desaturase, partial [Rhizobiaceae bacterium]|nr:fatty acid desaturase [Rhizobiaceae bacterium]